MSGVDLFSLSSQYSSWLTARQQAVSQNIANANTPGYTGIDVVPFADTLNRMPLELARTNVGHLADNSTGTVDTKNVPGSPWDVTLSGNSVNLEQELMKANDVNRSYTLTTSIAKSFQHMYLMTAK